MKCTQLFFCGHGAGSFGAGLGQGLTGKKSPRHREWISVKHDGRSVETFVVLSESKSKTSVVPHHSRNLWYDRLVQDLADQVR